MNTKTPLIVAGIVFIIVALAHLARIITQFELVIGGYAVPIWINVVAFFVSLALSIWMFKASA